MSSWGQGSTRNWRRTRQEVLERDNYECQLMLEGCLYAATEVHHRGGLQGAHGQPLPIRMIASRCAGPAISG